MDFGYNKFCGKNTFIGNNESVGYKKSQHNVWLQ